MKPLWDSSRLPEQSKEAGRRAAFDALIDRHAREIQSFLHKLCGNHHDAEELAQDVFIKAFRRLDSLREEKASRQWLYAIAVNHFNDWVRPKRRAILRSMVPIEESLMPAVSLTGPEQRAMNEELSRWLQEAVLRLPERQRTVLLLHSATGFDYQEIAKTLGISTDAVKMSLFHARERLRAKVERFLSQ